MLHRLHGSTIQEQTYRLEFPSSGRVAGQPRNPTPRPGTRDESLASSVHHTKRAQLPNGRFDSSAAPRASFPVMRKCCTANPQASQGATTKPIPDDTSHTPWGEKFFRVGRASGAGQEASGRGSGFRLKIIASPGNCRRCLTAMELD